MKTRSNQSYRKAQPKRARDSRSEQDRELERLLQRAALYQKRQPIVSVRRKRSQAA